jgi:hypothetical protein
MPRYTYGPKVEARVKRLLEALLDFVDGKFDESIFDIQYKWEAEDSANPRLIIRTRRVVLELLTAKDKHPGQLTDAQIREALKLLDKKNKKGLLKILEDNRTQTQGVDTQHFTLTLWSKDKEENIKQFEKAWKDSRPDKSKDLEATFNKSAVSGEALQNEIDWQDCCRKMLPTALSINPLLHGDGVVLTIEDIVPLELVERKQRPQQKDDFSPEHFQVQASIEYEVPVEHNKFLAQVLETGESLKNRDRKIAVIGEPGAGKTTLLQEIAKEVEGAGGLPIFVRLADLGEKTLKDYLLEDWLEEATGKRRISDDIQDDFVEQFNLGRVWLLLDGVDEIAATGNLLSSIEKQLKGWVSEARIVLTCRLNVWDVGKNDLYSFEKYRIQQLSYPDMVDKFICRFFFKAGEPTKGEKLIEKLERSQPRIRDLVKNPLRLTLLCRTWKRRQGELPQTKAELYKRFVETFYEWKDKPKIDQEKRLLLEQALGELAKNAIDKETTKFRLRESFVRQELGKFDKSLFDLACHVSWINNVGVAAENSDESVYAFFHPTFQEYFAALAIRDWKDFLNHVPHNPAQGIYRIFEPQWKEVILLWLGREDVLPAHKQEFLMALVNFDGKCCDLYRYRALFLATAGLTESREFLEFDDFCLEDNSEQGNEEAIELNSSYSLTELIVVLTCGSFNEKQRKWQHSPILLEQAAEAAILEIDRSLAITTLTNYYWNNLQKSIGCNWTTQWRITEILFKIAPKNSDSLRILEHLMLKCPKVEIHRVAYLRLAELELDFPNENNKLSEIFKRLFDDITQLFIDQVVNICNNFEDRGLNLNLGEPINTEQLTALTELIGDCTEPVTCQIASGELEQLNADPKTYETLLQLCASDNESIRRGAASALGKIYSDFPEVVTTAVNILINLIRTSTDESIYQNAALSIRQILQNQQFESTISALKSCRQNSVAQEDAVRYEAFYSVLFYCAYNLPYPTFYQAWHQQEEVDNTTTPNNQSLNQADLPQRLQSAIANDPQLSQIIHLICIDGSQFIERDRPAAEIYDQMLDQNCPECDTVPETMPALKLYWNSLKRKSDKRVVLVFYASSTHTTPAKDTAMPCPYSETFLSDLSKFGDRICVVTNQPFDHIPLKYFAPSQPIADVVEWIRAIAFS